MLWYTTPAETNYPCPLRTTNKEAFNRLGISCRGAPPNRMAWRLNSGWGNGNNSHDGAAGNLRPGNAGVPFYTDVLCPLLAIVLLIAARRAAVKQ